MSQETKDLINGVFEVVFNQRQLDKIGDYFHADYIEHSGTGDIKGLDAVRDYFGAWLTAFPDARTEVTNLIVEGDWAAWFVRFTGTNTGSLMGAPPTGKPIDVNIVNMGRMQDGKAIEHWQGGDIEAMIQLGVIQMPQMG